MTPLDAVLELANSAVHGAQHRTVISRAYYASFRTLVGVSTPRGFVQDQPVAVSKPLSVHRRLFNFLKASDVAVLRRIGRDVIEPLYRSRIKADYRFILPVTASEAKDAVLLATDIHDWIADAGLKQAF